MSQKCFSSFYAVTNQSKEPEVPKWSAEDPRIKPHSYFLLITLMEKSEGYENECTSLNSKLCMRRVSVCSPSLLQ